MPGMSVLVGPNGCGKSNLIEAIRWVIGGTSARQVRGTDMSQVIFNGSDARKSMARASVELILDNTDGEIASRFANYKEISVRRDVNRNGESGYFLNDTPCRRMDITDIFLGSGLGTNSYAIIEQGQIARMADSKPEQLRAFIEEAAGVSRYRVKRSSTEAKIERTLKNLEEVQNKQADRKQRMRELRAQIRIVEKSKRYRSECAELKAQQFALKARVTLKEQERVKQEHHATSGKKESVKTDLLNLEREEGELLEEFERANNTFNEAQAVFYQQKSTLERSEQSLKTHVERSEQCTRELTACGNARQKQLAKIAEEKANIEQVAEQLKRVETDYSARNTEVQQYRQDWQTCDSEVQKIEHALEEIDGQLEAARTLLRRAESECSEATQKQTLCKNHLRNLANERSRFSEQELTDSANKDEGNEYMRLQTQMKQLRADGKRLQHALAEAEKAFNLISKEHARLQHLSVQNASLKLATREQALRQYLEACKLNEMPMLIECLCIDDSWLKAICLVLEHHLHAYYLNDLDIAHMRLGERPNTETSWGFVTTPTVSASESSDAPKGAIWLHSMIKRDEAAGEVLASLCRGVMAVPNQQSAFDMRTSLGANESVVSRDGVWVGEGFVRFAGSVYDKALNVEALNKEFAEAEHQLQEAQQRLERERVALDEYRALETTRNETLLAASEAEGRRVERQNLHDKQRTRVAEIADEVASNEEALTGLAARGKQLDKALNEAQTHEKTVSELKHGQQKLRDKARGVARTARIALDEYSERMRVLELERERLQSAAKSANQNIEHLNMSAKQDKARTETLENEVQEIKTHIVELQSTLKPELRTHKAHEQAVEKTHDALSEIQQKQRKYRERHSEAQHKHDNAKAALSDLDLRIRELQMVVDNSYQGIKNEGLEVSEIMQTLSASDSDASISKKIDQITMRIERLGPVNMVAVQDLEKESKALSLLEEQHKDVLASLDNLQQVMQRIDSEARKQFFDTVKRLDKCLLGYFKRLFNGGEVSLKVEGNDPWSGGVFFHARPPGKRNQIVYQLSGGEKTLLSIALIFAIFELNRAPFCLLDEVDAALDDANIKRFVLLLREVQKRVQLICVSHNPLTMEQGDYLLGISMKETGVSQVIGVNLESVSEMVAQSQAQS